MAPKTYTFTAEFTGTEAEAAKMYAALHLVWSLVGTDGTARDEDTFAMTPAGIRLQKRIDHFSHTEWED